MALCKSVKHDARLSRSNRARITLDTSGGSIRLGDNGLKNGIPGLGKNILGLSVRICSSLEHLLLGTGLALDLFLPVCLSWSINMPTISSCSIPVTGRQRILAMARRVSESILL
ncbi:hypothetical protein GMOD_00010041 [Pyrenophora seminiperda CCB06]|uniref:Uncharacterized protein n=1 Tax=Pyrenophora seminiperda CCB06 TaxID=1302712 RepID=A0A3M7M1Y0_9PLEO|nr:hypothetical protein GMOD_00010041 [Pyrenophora seminiperda CCB06]